MKKGLIFATTLAMALGVGVAVGAHQGKAAEVKAATEVTIYYAVETTYTVKANLCLQYNGEQDQVWQTYVMSKNGATVGGVDVYSCTFTDLWDGARTMQLQQYDGETWKSQVIPFENDWHAATVYNGKLWDNSEKEWVEYSPDTPVVKHSVICVLDGQAQSPVQVAEGELPAAPAAQWGKSFSGWCSDAECTTPVAAITADTTVYGKITTLPEITYTVDVSKVSSDFTESNLHLWAWEPNGLNNAEEWPGVEVDKFSFKIPSDASLIINNGGNGHQTVNITQSGVANDTLRILTAVDGEGHNEYEWASDDIPSVYKVSINGIEETMTQNTEPGKESEYVSVTKSFKKGDVLTFRKDDAAYAVSPKEDGAFTKVYENSGALVFAQDYSDALYLETNGGYLWAGQYDAGVYLVGSFNDWNLKLGYPAEKEAEGDCYFVKGQAFAKDDQVIMVSYPAEGNALTYHEAVPGNTKTQSEVDFTVMTEGAEKGNVKLNKAGTYDIYCNPSDDPVYYGIEDPAYEPDVPAEEGYYIVGTESGWKFAGATELGAGDDDNLAKLISYEAKAGEEFRIRGYHDGVATWYSWGQAEEGHENDNFVVGEADRELDIYLNKLGEYYVFDHPVELEHVLSIGGQNLIMNKVEDKNEYMVSNVELEAGDGVTGFTIGGEPVAVTSKKVANNNLNEDKEVIADIDSADIYYDADNKTLWVSGLPTGGQHLLINGHTLVEMNHTDPYEGYDQYATGMLAFAANDTIKVINTGVENDYADIWCPAIAATSEKLEGKFVYDNENKEMKCVEACEASVYLKIKYQVDEIYFGDVPEYVEEAIEYVNGFKAAMATACSAKGKKAAVEAAWVAQATAYAALSEQARAEVYKGGFSLVDEIQEFGERYIAIKQQHSDWTLENFLEWEIPASSRYGGMEFASEANNSTMIIIISIAAASVLAFTTLLVFKKRKQK